jgi:tRNA pseudouridine55 synthase
MRVKRGKAVNGLVLLDKPADMTSNRALQTVRRLFDARKAGHTGNLDPFATGMLPICLGEASKTAGFMIDSDKTYRAIARLGIATETGDIEGPPVNKLVVPDLAEQKVVDVFTRFTGEIEQTPPMYSALKHKGQPLYKLARQGIIVDRKPRKCIIHKLNLLKLDTPMLQFEVRCSKGTYIRTLAEDLAGALGTCAHLVGLRRLSVEPFENKSMVTLERLEDDAGSGALIRHLLPLDAGLQHWPLVRLGAMQAAGFSNGNPQSYPAARIGWVRVYDRHDRPLGLAEYTEQGLLKPRRVFNL